MGECGVSVVRDAGGVNYKLQNANYKQNYKDTKNQTIGMGECGVSVVRDAGGVNHKLQNADYKRNYKDSKNRNGDSRH